MQVLVYPIEVTQHIGGFCAFVDARAYRDFRWTDQFKHGNQDSEASMEFRKLGYMPCYIPKYIESCTWIPPRDNIESIRLF